MLIDLDLDFDIFTNTVEPFERELDILLGKLDGSISKKTAQAMELESHGWKVWLKTLAPMLFRSAFCHEQEQYWEFIWHIWQKKFRGEALTPKESNFIVPFGRGLGKSAGGEMSCIMEGCVVGYGYDLYLSDTQEMAEDHLDSIRDIMENDQVGQFYPHMATLRDGRKPVSSKSTDNVRYLRAAGGNWSVLARGLRGNVRGGRKGGYRFTYVNLDDIDRLDESIVVVNKKERAITRTIFGAMNKGGVVGIHQNPIAEGTVVNRTLEKTNDILNERTIICGGPVSSFKKVTIEMVADEDGDLIPEIVDFEARWEYLDIGEAKTFLSRAGKEAFEAEYQNVIKTRKGKMIPDYDDKLQVITWDQFAAVYGVRYIPMNWRCKSGADMGYSEQSLSAWTWTTTAAMDSNLPKLKFNYRGRNFAPHTSIDDQMLWIWKSMFPTYHPETNPTGRKHFEAEINFGMYPDLFRLLSKDEWCKQFLTGYRYDPDEMVYIHPTEGMRKFYRGQVVAWWLSHEKSGELLTARQKYGTPLSKTKHFGDADGTTQWNNLCQADHTRPHPFIEDEIADEELGLYKYGCPGLFYIVENDSERLRPTGDQGFKLHRRNVSNWMWAPQIQTERGLSDPKPMKMATYDSVDSERMIFADFGTKPKDLSDDQKFERDVSREQPVLARESIEKLAVNAQQFAVAEKNLAREEWDKGHGASRQGGTDVLDF